MLKAHSRVLMEPEPSIENKGGVFMATPHSQHHFCLRVAHAEGVVEPTGEIPFIFYGPISEVEEKARPNRLAGQRHQTRRIQARIGCVFRHYDRRRALSGSVSILGQCGAPKGGSGCAVWKSDGFSRDLRLRPYFGGKPLSSISGEIFADKPDLAAAERLLRQSVTLDPTAFFVHVELGNVYLRQGRRDDALRAYSDALRYAPIDHALRQPIQAQIQRVSSGPSNRIDTLRDPFLE